MNKIKKFFKDVLREMKYVSWPTWADLKEGTVVVVTMSAVISAFLFLVDWVFTLGIHFILP